jgi:hypothetical protein
VSKLNERFDPVLVFMLEPVTDIPMVPLALVELFYR